MRGQENTKTMSTATLKERLMAPIPRPDKGTQVGRRTGTVLTMPWQGGHKESIRNFAQSLEKLGYHVIEEFRGVGPWRDKAINFIEEVQPSLYITWQRFYARTWAGDVNKVLSKYSTPKLVFDFGVWPHYGSAIIDTMGENATSAMVGRFDHYEGIERYRKATDAAMSQIESARKEIERRAAEAEKKKAEYGLDQIPKDFIFLVLQRTGDQVLRFDATKIRRDVKRVMWDVINESARQGGPYVVAKPHPLDKRSILENKPPRGPSYRVVGEKWAKLEKRPLSGLANDQINAWLLKNCGHVVVVNSTMSFDAMIMGKPVCMFGDGWATGNNVAKKCLMIKQAIQQPTIDLARAKRFVAAMYSRQLTIKECADPKKVEALLDLHYPQLSPDYKRGTQKPAAQTPIKPKIAVTGFIVTWRRPKGAQRAVDAMRAHGIDDIWVWCNDGVTPPQGASRIFTCNDNIGNWQRFGLLASMADTSHILYCDDDAIVTDAGYRGLLKAAQKDPSKIYGIWGWRWTPPYQHYKKRTDYWAHKVKEHTVVDMVSPCGMIAPRWVMAEATGKVEYWKTSEQVFRDHTCDDLAFSCALPQCSSGRPLVVHAPGGRGIAFKDDSPKNSLRLAPGRLGTLYHCLPKFISAGWTPYNSNGISKHAQHK